MNKYVLMLAAAGLIAAAPVYYAVSAQAEDAAAPAADAAADAAAHVEAKEVTLKDGTKVSVEGDVVSVVAADGTKTPAPDGEHEAADGSKITTKDGKLVH